MMRILIIAGVAAIALAGCAPPTFENVVFNSVSKTARVLEPKGFLPYRSQWLYRNNAFRIPAGSVIVPVTSRLSNPFTQVAGSLGEADRQCFQQVYRMHQVKAAEFRRPAVNVSYDFEIVLGSPFTRALAIQEFKQRTDIAEMPENAFTYIRKVEFQIRNLRVYELNEEQQTKALTALRLAGGCSALDERVSGMIVRRIYVGNVRTYVRWDDGFDITLGTFWKDRLQRSLRDTFDGKNIVFAVETEPLGLF